VGGVLGHSICTGLAVVGGRMIAQKISVKTGKKMMCLCSSDLWVHLFSRNSHFEPNNEVGSRM
jgi:putative Ca2+/H+ antiporter (TMEM165/GDT1 family)